MTLSMRNRRPEAKESDTKSSDQRCWVPAGSLSAPASQRALAVTTFAHRQPFLAIQPVDLLQIHALSLSLEHDRQPSTAELATLVSDLAHPLANSIILPAKRLILPC